MWALSNGGSFFSPDGKSVTFDDAAIEILQKVFNLHLVEKPALVEAINGSKTVKDVIGATRSAMQSALG